MSRHKLVKTMNLDDELDDFDGGDNYGYDGEIGFEERTPLSRIGHKCNEADLDRTQQRRQTWFTYLIRKTSRIDTHDTL